MNRDDTRGHRARDSSDESSRSVDTVLYCDQGPEMVIARRELSRFK
jgi:hypothetical protein